MGISEERAYKLTKDSKKNINVLRRLIADAPEIHTPNWAKPENARALDSDFTRWSMGRFKRKG